MLTWLATLGTSLLWLLAGFVLLISAYMVVVVLGSWLSRRGSGALRGAPRIAVIVPAHNEESGIAETVQQLLAATYDGNRPTILVLADNCTDATAERAAAAGARTLVRTDAVNRGKGQALDWVIRVHADRLRQFELLAFVDADMSVEPAFFEVMAAEFSDPAVIAAQGRYVVSNPCDSVLSAIGFASFCYVNHVRPAGRSYWGGTADLKGSGMVFRSEFLLARGWGAHSIAEDFQLGKDLLLEGVRVYYVSAACVRSAIPASLSQVRVQQSRWEGGKRSVYAALVRRTWSAFVRTPSWKFADALLDLFVPPISLIVVAMLVGLVASLALQSSVYYVFAFGSVVFGAAVMTGLLQNRAPFGVYWRLLAAPLFVLWKVLLLLSVAIRPAQSAWHRTPRDHEAQSAASINTPKAD